MLHTFHTISPGCTDSFSHAKDLICDKDPSVMGAALNVCLLLAEDQKIKQGMKSFVKTFVEILTQIIEHRLPNEYDYHRLPAPWIQIKLIRLLGILAKDDKDVSTLIYRVIGEVIQKADIGLNIGSAVVYECVNTITLIYPNSTLIETGAAAISRFITSKLRNLQYLGIQMLKNMVKINPKCAAQHQGAVMECLEDNDESIKRVTLDLLYAMTNPNNFEVIVKKLLSVAKKSVIDTHLREELIRRISYLAENFAPDSFWYIQTMNKLFELGSEYIPSSYVQNMLNIIAEGVNDVEMDEKIRIYCVETYVEMLEKNDNIPDKLLQVIAWILGEYGYLSKKHQVSVLVEKLSEITERKIDDETKGWVLTAIMKLSANLGEIPKPALEILRNYLNSRNVNVQQRAYEYLVLRQDTLLMDTIFPQDGSAEDLEVDGDLSFLDDYVDDSLKKGARRYVSEDQRAEFEKVVNKHQSALKTDQYKPPEVKKTNMHSSFAQGVSIEFDVSNVKDYDDSYKEKSEFKITDQKRVWFEDDDEEPTLNLKQPNSIQNQNNQQTGPKPIEELAEPEGIVTLQPINENKQEPVYGGQEFETFKKQEEPKKKISKESEKLVSGIFGTSEKQNRKVIAKKKTQSTVQKHQWEEIQKEEQPVPIPIQQTLFEEMEPIKQQQPPQKIQNSPLIELFSDSPKPQVQKTIVKEEPKTTGIFDFFMGPTTPEKKEISQETKKGNILSLYDRPIEPTLQKDIPLQTFTTNLNDSIILSKDSYITVSSKKIKKDNSLDIEMIFSTTTGFSLTSLYAQFQPPEKFSMEFITNSQCSIRGNAITFQILEPGSPIQLTLKLTLQDPGFGSQLMGSISYSDPKQNKQLISVSTKVEIKDLLVPITLSTSDYGKYWKQYSIEKKNVFTGSPSMENIESIIKDKIRGQVVSVIKNEVISAVKIISLNKICLMHVKVSSGVHFTIKSESGSLNEKVSLFAKQCFESK